MACGVPEERAAQIAQCFELKKDMLLECEGLENINAFIRYCES